MNIQTSAQIAVKEAMSLTGCRTQEEIAERIGVSQNAIWKLLNGRSKTTKYKTALAFEKVTNGAVSRFRFLEEQGATNLETPNGTECHLGSSDASQTTALESGIAKEGCTSQPIEY